VLVYQEQDGTLMSGFNVMPSSNCQIVFLICQRISTIKKILFKYYLSIFCLINSKSLVMNIVYYKLVMKS
jgi:hypothetical protein